MQSSESLGADKLRSFIDRLEKLEEEKREVQEQFKDVMAEAKGEGFDTRIIRQILKLRRMRDHERMEQEELLDLYKSALGMG